MYVPILLAAGSSTRMGRPKPLCDFDGRTALQLALDTAKASGIAEPIVVLGHSCDEIREKVPLNGCTVVVNEKYESGQTSSLKCGLAALSKQAKGFLLWPVDYPLITDADVRAVVETFEKIQPKGKRIFIPSYGLKRGHPALIDVELKGEFEALPDTAPARTIINRFAAKIQHVDVAESYVLMDMDTPAEYDSCLKAFRDRERNRNR